MKKYFCWKCQKELPFLEESEFLQIEPDLTQTLQAIKDHRGQNGSDIATARAAVQEDVLNKFFELTNYRAKEYDFIWHHDLRKWGPECSECGHLLRSPKASFCVECGKRREGAA